MKQKLPLLLSLAALLLGASSAKAITTTFSAVLSPEAPGATGTGTAVVIYDDTAQTLMVQVDFSGLTGKTTVAHIHAPTAVAGMGTAGVAVTPGTLPGFPVGEISGNYSTVIDLASSATYTAAFLTASGGTVSSAEAALFASLSGGKSYLNIHTSTYPGGEIRGFLTQIPDSGTSLALLGLGLTGLALVRRRIA